MARYPDFIIFGAAKSGTTTLFKYLRCHPEIYLPEKKEPEFYSVDRKFRTERDWYESLFAAADPLQLVGEASQTYSMWPHFPLAAERIAAELPNVKLIYIMRNPVDRAYSFYLQLLKMGQITQRRFRVNRTFEECLFPERFPNRSGHEAFMGSLHRVFPDTPGLFLDVSDYALQLEKYLEFFSRDQLHLILLEDLVRDPASAIRDLFRFLDVEDIPMPSFDAARANVSQDYFDTSRLTSLMLSINENLFLKRLSRMAPPLLKGAAKRLVLSKAGGVFLGGESKPPEMMDVTRAWLEDYFAPKIERLKTLTGIEISAWRT